MPKEKEQKLSAVEAIAQQSLDAMRAAFEWGFKCAEKGMNIQAALQRFDKQMEDKCS